MPGRTQPISYLVLHYTAGKNDTARANVSYFANNKVGASAHYFVDETGWEQSVDDCDTAWAVGTAGTYQQKHPHCRNSNSISIELCCRYENGKYSFSPKTVEHACRLTQRLMRMYNIPIDHVLRHYDVVNKCCPEPWVRQTSLWEAFLKALEEELDMTKEELMRLAGTGDHPSDWAKEATSWAKEQGIFRGDGEGNFAWQAPISREAVAQVLLQMQKLIAQYLNAK